MELGEFDIGTYVRARAMDGSGTELGWTQASDRDGLFDAPVDVRANDLSNRLTPASGSKGDGGSGTTSSTSSSISDSSAGRLKHSVQKYNNIELHTAHCRI